MTESLSQNYFFKSRTFVPGGVHSPVRSFKGLPMNPLFMERAEGAHIFSVDGAKYIDFCMSFGPLITGHKDPEVQESIMKALERGWSYGACEPYSLNLAEYLIEKIPFIDQIRFVSSGTEAVMTALRLARGFTGRNKILKFHGCYHGHVDSMLIKSGSGLAGTMTASSAGIPEGVVQDTLVVPLGDYLALEEVFRNHGNELAAVIMEPIPANYGLLQMDEKFCQHVRAMTKKSGALFIADEVITGFRLGLQGMSGKWNLNPDLVTYGKVIGGGLPVAALAGKKDIMEHLAPMGNVYQAGTLSANPLGMVAGLTLVKKLNEDFYTRLEKRSERIGNIFQKYLNSHWPDLEGTIHRVGSLFWPHFSHSQNKAWPVCVEDIGQHQGENFSKLFCDLIEKGVYLAPNGYEVGFVSMAHNDSVIQELEEKLCSSPKAMS
jgi:glutamate-1-semialdehyde 2,1-aminomutase